MELDGRVAVVTGGTRGVGAGIARAFVAAGAEVVVCARRPPDVPVPDDRVRHRCDVRDPDAVGRLLRAVAARYGRLDVLVNNAGGTPYRPLAQAGAERHAGSSS